ncbi:PilZ domain-containing protein [Citrobacter portucalensis]|nr:PilZ domain-containing protein [Citrobacter portucalensis]EFN9698441.1 PilZ domain-containing protein [Escherichia coli]MDE9662998.1 PilZ domain-containing protein [Citrobacter portucalensis]MDE9672946.1 PilZ domain-containing protein [Citrobacter portucalensis]
MSEGVSKNSRYEIIAILRDELRIQSKLYFYCNDIKHQSTLKKIEGNFFYIKPSTSHPGLPKESIFYFIIHSPLGKIEFTTNNRITDKSNSNNLLCFIIPESLSILQRRTSPRINVGYESQFYCSGRYRSGTIYKYHLNDISEGGCSFISLEPLHSFIRNGNKLENSVLNLGEYGQILVNLKIKHISEENNRKQCDATRFRVSCMFYYESEEKKEKIEKIIVKLIIDRKIINRRSLV